jgi:hypothetical protein
LYRYLCETYTTKHQHNQSNHQKTQFLEFISNMATSNVDIERIIALINKGDVEALKAEDYDQFQYQGFNPIKIVQALYKVKKDKSINDSDFVHDVFRMVAIGMIKGSVNDHNITKMSDEGKSQLTSLIAEYGIKKGGGRGESSSVITFPRVMATFPDIAVRMAKVIGAKEFSGGPMLSTRLPYYLQVQVFPAVIPRHLDKDAKKMLLTASLCYTIDQSTQISNLKDPDLKALASTQSNFTMVGHNSPVPSSEVRMSVFNKLSLSADYDKISSVLQDYKSKIDNSFDIMDKATFVKCITEVK